LREFIQDLRSHDKTIIGYGASTKGNVLLQFCGLTDQDISCVAEVNEEKFGCFCPGSHIPIISEQEARKNIRIIFLFCRGTLKKIFSSGKRIFSARRKILNAIARCKDYFFNLRAN